MTIDNSKYSKEIIKAAIKAEINNIKNSTRSEAMTCYYIGLALEGNTIDAMVLIDLDNIIPEEVK